MSAKVHSRSIRSIKGKKKMALSAAGIPIGASIEKLKVIADPGFNITNKATKRILAPFVRIVRKAPKQVEIAPEEETKFSHHLQRVPSVLIRDLSQYLSDNFVLVNLLHQTKDVLQLVTKSPSVTLYMIDLAANELFQEDKEMTEERHRIRWPMTEKTTVAAHVALFKEHLIVDDLALDCRFPEGIGFPNEHIKSVLSSPVLTPEGACFAVIELYKTSEDPPFTEDDLNVSVTVTLWMGVAIQQNQQRLTLKRQLDLNDYLVKLTQCFFSEVVPLEKLIIEITKLAKQSLGAEQGTFYAIYPDNDDLLADQYNDNSLEVQGGYRGVKVRLARERSVAALVAKSGRPTNIKDAYQTSRFSFSKEPGDYKGGVGTIIRAIVCVPLLTKEEKCMGVIQVVNKKNGGCFLTADEMLLTTFSVYCQMALHYTRLRSKIEDLVHLNNCYQDVLKLQWTPCVHSLGRILEPLREIPDNFHDFSWYIEQQQMDKIPMFCLKIFLSIIDPSEVHLDGLTKFILAAQMMYRKHPYHNFNHAFNTLHCMYLILRSNMFKFRNLEVKALLVAALCVDIDHPGFTNSYLQHTKDDMYYLHKTSSLENHHYDTTLILLEQFKIFEHVGNYEDFKAEIKHAIMSTDLEQFILSYHKLRQIIEAGGPDWENEDHRSMIKALIMRSCDLSGRCKPYLTAKAITEAIYVESYNQGDLERKLGLCPLSTMDRDKGNVIPEDQIQFLSIVLIPMTELLKDLLPNTEGLYIGACYLRGDWEISIATRGKKVWRQEESFVTKAIEEPRQQSETAFSDYFQNYPQDEGSVRSSTIASIIKKR